MEHGHDTPELIMPKLPKQWIDYGRSIGASGCICRYYSSDGYLKNIEPETYALTQGRCKWVFIDGERWERKYVGDPQLLFSYDRGKALLDYFESRRLLSGDYLVVGVYRVSDTEPSNPARLARETAAALRLAYGHDFLRQLHAELGSPLAIVQCTLMALWNGL
jgi:hypothetical protein